MCNAAVAFSWQARIKMKKSSQTRLVKLSQLIQKMLLSMESALLRFDFLLHLNFKTK